MRSLKHRVGLSIRRGLRERQQGIATILVILMIGVGVVAVSVGTMHTMRNTQERQLVAQSQINAQAGAWSAVEAVRKYLGTLEKAQLAALEGNTNWTLAGVDGLTQAALIKTIEAPTGTEAAFKITAEVSALAAAGQASSTVEVVYAITPNAGDGSMNLSGVLDFYNDLKATGGITLNAPDRKGMDFNVDGNFSVTSAGVAGTGFGNINVTGNILLDSQVAADVVRGRNVKLIQSANVARAEAWGIPKGETGSVGDGAATEGKGYTCCGNIVLATWGVDSTAPVVGTAHANGDVTSTAGKVTTILSRRDVTVSGKGVVSATAMGNASISAWTDSVGSMIVGGNFTKSAGVGNNGASFSVLGKADCPSAIDTTKSQVLKIKDASKKNANCTGTADTALAAPTVDKVAEVKLKAPVVDTRPLKAAANYAIEFTADKKIRVTVKNVNGIADGEYYLGTFDKVQMHLCKAVTIDASGNPKCNTSGTGALTKSEAMPFCINHDENTTCISADFTNKVLGIKADSIPAAMPAGVIWFDGTIKLAGGPFFNTFVATENIDTYGDLTVYSVNYGSDYKMDGSSNAICKNERGASTFSQYTARFPTNFCSSSGVFSPQPIGNIGLIAGSYNTATPPAYVGGNITLTAKTSIYGTVVAGNILDTSGATTVYGYISASGLKQRTDETNDLTASLTVDLTKRPKDYNPEKIPQTDPAEGGAGTLPEAKVLWSRYL